MSPRSNRKKTQHLVSGQLQKNLTSLSCKLEPTIWSCDAGQRIPCFDRCQLILTWMSNIKEGHSVPRLHVSVNPLFGVWPQPRSHDLYPQARVKVLGTRLVWPPCCATPSPLPSCVRTHKQYR